MHDRGFRFRRSSEGFRIEAFMNKDSLSPNDFRKLLSDMKVMKLAKLMKKLVRKFHFVGPDIAPSDFIARSVDLRIVFRKTLKRVKQADVAEIEDVAHGLAKNASRPAAQHAE